MRRIFSAGGIVVCEIEGEKKVLLAQHSGHKGWDFPKGHIEKGEGAKEAAVREVEEETGVKAEVVEKAGETQYFYKEGKEKVFKTVTYFLMRYVGEGKATTAFEVMAMEWLPIDKVEAKLTFKDTQGLWSGVEERVRKLELIK